MKKKQLSWKWIPFVFVLFFSLLFIFFQISGIFTLEKSKAIVEATGSLAGVMIFLLLVSDLVTPVPSSILMTLAGNLYGPLWGTLLNTCASLLASVIGFMLCRYLARIKTRKFISEENEQSMNRWFHTWGEGILVLSRMLPMVTETMSCFAGLTSITFKRFFIFIFVGTLPISFFYAYFGSKATSIGEWSFPLIIGVLVPGLLWIVIQLIISAKNKKKVDS